MSSAQPALHLNDEGFKDLRAALVWGADLELTDEQRSELRGLCFKLVGPQETPPDHRVPLAELLNERQKRQAAEKRVKELKAKMPKRWWQF